jgi:hypothetical protein
VTHALTGERSLRAVGVVAGVLGAGVLMAGCKEVEPTVAAVHEPATVEEVDGLDVALVRFDRPGAERVDLSTERVRRTGDATVVPYAAVIYDPQGVAWVYTRSAPLTFQRVEVVVDRVVGDRAWLTDGPPPGTRVVTTGATEVYGAELGIAGGH